MANVADYPALKAERDAHRSVLPDSPPLGELGWQHTVSPDDEEVQRLRAQLEEEAGMPGFEASCVWPDEPNYGEKAAEILRRDGFVIVKHVLDPERLAIIRRGVDQVVRHMLSYDEARWGNRGSHRYSLGSAPAHFGYQQEWSVLVDPPALKPVLTAIFGTPDYVNRTAASGGDFVLPGCLNYQALHADGPSGRHPIREKDVDVGALGFCVTYPMEIVHDPSHTVGHGPCNGATRQIRYTQTNRSAVPPLESEPRWMLCSTTSPAEAGDAFVRDNRGWHGGTPNLGKFVRAIPDAKFGPPDPHENYEKWPKTLPYEVWETMSPHGQHITRGIVAPPGQKVEIPWGGIDDELGSRRATPRPLRPETEADPWAAGGFAGAGYSPRVLPPPPKL